MANFCIVLLELEASRCDGLILNLSGRQRMLSQRILIYSKDYLQPERRNEAKKQLNKLLREWESSAIRIDQYVEKTTFYYVPLLKSYKECSALSFLLLHDCKNLVRELTLTEKPSTTQLSIIEHKLNDFLASMEKTVESYQRFHELKLVILKYLEIAGIVFSLILIVLIITRIAIPAQKSAQHYETTLKSLNHQLSWAMEQSRLLGFTLHVKSGRLKWTGDTLQILGYQETELQDIRSLFEKTNADHQKGLQNAFDQLLKEKKRSFFECKVERYKNSHSVIIGQLEYVGISNGEDRMVQGIIQDVTKYNNLKNEVNKTHRIFNTVIQNSPDAYFFVSIPENTISDCNETALRLFGYSSKKELVGTYGVDLQVNPFTEAELKEALFNIENLGHHAMQMDYKKKDGSIFHGFLSISMLKEFNVQVVRVTDISERFHSEKALRELKNELEEAHELSGLGSWSHLTGNQYFSFSPQASQLLGITDENLRFTYDDFSRLVHPDDRKRLADSIENCFSSAGLFNQEVRFLHQSGEYKWLLTQGKPKYDAKGKVIGILGTFMDVHKRKITELENKLLANVADKTDNGVIITNPEGLITWINSGFTRISGYTLDDLKNKKPGSVLQGPQSDRSAIKRIAEKIKRHEGFNEELINYTKDGNTYWTQINASPVFNEYGTLQYFIAIQQDITKRKETEQKVIESREKYKRAQMLAHLGHWSIRFKPLSIDWSEELYVIYGRDKALGPPNQDEYFKKILHTDDIEHSLAQIEKARKEGFSQFVQRIIRPDGSTRYLETNCQPIYEKERLMGVNGTCIDITEKVLAEQQLIIEKKKAEEASKAKAEFLSVMSHEIRTSLNAIIGLSQLLLQNSPRPDQLEQMKTLRFSGENLLSLINDILDFSKIEAGKIQIEKINFDFKELTRSLHHTFSFTTQEKNIKFRLTEQEGIPQFLLGDPVRLTQILNNLLGNAVKFTDKGYVGLSIKIVEQKNEGIRLLFEVEDTGIGISLEQQVNIFEKFTQASASITRKYGGTGLGLSITKKLLQLLGSDIHLQSKPGEGSTFGFELYFELPAIASKSRSGTELHHVDSSELAGARVLLAEDNKINVMVARQFLEGWKFTVDVAENGIKAIEKLCENKYDVVLMDLQMPEMDGITATQLIKKENLGEGVPIIALTASALAEVQEQVFQAGMIDFVTKPFQPGELKLKLSKAISQSKGMI